ncbi:histone-fold-containing protein [Massariosphaeria phaeospora]|uniref:NCT transcriptional regulatory complex subunit A n=1 Tax=Massariosphaeria phaeospora TaxID=100035 RepID=A0A7C8IF60_9PLEO|nr:histone-fold-containing protein [Massariosphaeria phaeospora]
MPRGIKSEPMQDADYVPDASEGPRGKKPKVGNGTSGAPAEPTALPGTEHIKITYHFPVARIKRIMQADDDVGKVAQVTPVAVSKALELFMISIVTKAAAKAKESGSKRVTTSHLKQAVTNVEQFDFLSEIVSKVPDAPSAADKNDPDAMDVDGKKKRSSVRRKRKADDEDF